MKATDDDLIRRKAAAFDAIAERKVAETWDVKDEQFAAWPLSSGWPVSRSLNLLDAIESALSVDRQTPKPSMGSGTPPAKEQA